MGDPVNRPIGTLDTFLRPMGRSKKLEIEEIVIDLTLSGDESLSEEEIQKHGTLPKTPFDPPLNISGNILESRHYKILKSHSSWFTDDIINAFFCILKAKNEGKCFVFSSFFYDSLLRKGKAYCLKHWTKGIKAFIRSSIENKIVLLPVNSGGSHWVLVTWSVEGGTLNYYDSLMCKRSGNRIMKKMTEFFNEMKGDVEQEEDIDNLLFKLSFNETEEKKQFEFPLIKYNFIPKGQIQQTDGSSCGPFCCLNGEILLKEKNDKTANVVDIFKFRESLIEYFIKNSNILN